MALLIDYLDAWDGFHAQHLQRMNVGMASADEHQAAYKNLMAS